MHKLTGLVGLLLLTAGSALAQSEFPKVEVAPQFMFIRTPVAGQSLNCAGGGGTFAYNLTSSFGLAADLGYCKTFGNTFGLNDRITGGSEYTYLFGPRLTFRNHTPFHPFFDLNFGGARLAFSCTSTNLNCRNRLASGDFSENAFALTVGGGFDVKLNRNVALRAIQAEYLYTRFANGCPFNTCINNNQNSFRLKSGIVFGFGGGGN
jgi:opacity protein-like surface antigen